MGLRNLAVTKAGTYRLISMATGGLCPPSPRKRPRQSSSGAAAMSQNRTHAGQQTGSLFGHLV